MKREGSVNLFQYWNRLRDGRPAPKRTEIEPADIKTHLGDTFILETDTRGEAVFRLAGTRLCAMYGRELKGFAFTSLWRDKDAPMMSRLVSGVFQDKTVLVVAYQGITPGNRSLPLELLLLPLEGGEENRRALGIISPETKPFWLGADPITDAALETVRVVDADREPFLLRSREALPETSQVKLAPPMPDLVRNGARRIRHLVVLPGGRTG